MRERTEKVRPGGRYEERGMTSALQVRGRLGLMLLICLAAVALPLGTGFAVSGKSGLPLAVGEMEILVEVPRDREAFSRGLSGRESLGEGEGMLFDFRGSGRDRPGFWMKGMLISLDLIWIRGGIVVGITPRVPAPPSPSSPVPLYYPPGPVDMVLEVSAGWAERHSVSVGDAVAIGF